VTYVEATKLIASLSEVVMLKMNNVGWKKCDTLQ